MLKKRCKKKRIVDKIAEKTQKSASYVKGTERSVYKALSPKIG